MTRGHFNHYSNKLGPKGGVNSCEPFTEGNNNKILDRCAKTPYQVMDLCENARSQHVSSIVLPGQFFVTSGQPSQCNKYNLPLLSIEDV